MMNLMSQHYTPEFKRNIVRLRLDEGRTVKSITAEYGVPKGTISNWCRKYREECQEKAESDPNTINTAEIMEENARLRKELAEAQKEVNFLKKAAAFFAKEID